jgi:hypothetical protein
MALPHSYQADDIVTSIGHGCVRCARGQSNSRRVCTDSTVCLPTRVRSGGAVAGGFQGGLVGEMTLRYRRSFDNGNGPHWILDTWHSIPFSKVLGGTLRL